MTKTELIADIEANSIGVVTVALQEEGTLQNGKTFKKYNANVLAKEGESQNFKNIPFTVLDEGLAGEEAFLTQGLKKPALDVARKAIETYMATVPNVIRYVIGNVNEETRDARVVAIVNNGNGTASEKQFFVYKNGAEPITHVEIV